MTRGREIAGGGRHRTALRLAAPWLIGLLGLTVFPAIASFLLSFTDWNGLSFTDGIRWIGTAHYRRVWTDVFPPPGVEPALGRALRNSLHYTLLAVPAGLAASLGAALLLNRPGRAMALFRTIIVLPYLMGGVATLVIWSWLFNPRFGPVNELIRGGYDVLHPLVRLVSDNGTRDWPVPDWLYSPQACRPVLVLLHVWLSGSTVLVLLAALQRVPASLIEAALLDGAGGWARFRHVTLPAIYPAILFVTVVGCVNGMQSFDEAYVLYDRSQEDGLLFYMLHLYRIAFEAPHELGHASALAWTLFMILAIPLGAMLLGARRWLHEAGRP